MCIDIKHLEKYLKKTSKRYLSDSSFELIRDKHKAQTFTLCGRERLFFHLSSYCKVFGLIFYPLANLFQAPPPFPNTSSAISLPFSL